MATVSPSPGDAAAPHTFASSRKIPSNAIRPPAGLRPIHADPDSRQYRVGDTLRSAQVAPCCVASEAVGNLALHTLQSACLYLVQEVGSGVYLTQESQRGKERFRRMRLSSQNIVGRQNLPGDRGVHESN